MNLNPLERLVRALTRLPGIGERSATRLSLFLVKDEKGVAEELAHALLGVKERVRFCSLCQDLTEEPICPLCRNERRNGEQLCIVEGPADLLALEKTGEYRGYYFILHGALSPLEGVGPEEMKFERVLKRVKQGHFGEVILAMNPTAEGEATALYLKELLTPQGVKTTRIASGVPVGGTLEYTDAQTLARSLISRREF